MGRIRRKPFAIPCDTNETGFAIADRKMLTDHTGGIPLCDGYACLADGMRHLRGKEPGCVIPCFAHHTILKALLRRAAHPLGQGERYIAGVG